MRRHGALTSRYGGPARSLHCPVQIGPPVVDRDSITPEEALLKARTYAGIWDTGATGSVVTEKVITECGLIPIGMTQVHHSQGKSLSYVYRVSFFLPSGLSLPLVHVTRGELTGCDVLIGMDVIGTGDFAVSSDHGKTVFSFRHPSAGPIDFTSPESTVSPGQKVGRNSPCPCGSGRKYKKCHGRRT